MLKKYVMKSAGIILFENLCLYCIQLVHLRVRGEDLVNTVINLWDTWGGGGLILSQQKTMNFSRKTLHR
jgi:hypothetical protein